MTVLKSDAKLYTAVSATAVETDSVGNLAGYYVNQLQHIEI